MQQRPAGDLERSTQRVVVGHLVLDGGELGEAPKGKLGQLNLGFGAAVFGD